MYAMCPDGSHVERLATTATDDYVAAVAPDGKLAVSLDARVYASTPRLAVFDRRKLVPLGPTDKFLRNPSWFPDAQALVAEGNMTSLRDLFRVALDGTITQLTHEPKGAF